MFGIERFRGYMLGGKFQTRTDHKPLVKVLGLENANASQTAAPGC